jgi:hypothetical protein
MFFAYVVDVVEAGCDLDYGVVEAATGVRTARMADFRVDSPTPHGVEAQRDAWVLCR